VTENKNTKLEDLKPGASIEGLTPSGPAKVINIEWFGDQAVKVIFENAEGAVQDRLVYRDEEHSLKVASAGQFWSFDANGSLLRLVTEANRIKLAHHLIPTSLFIRAWYNPSLIKLPPSMANYYVVSLFVSYWPMTQVQAKPLWLVCLLKSL